MPQTSPKITGESWGNIEVEGHGSFKDVLLGPGFAKEWDWNESGTSHESGIQAADAKQVVDQGAEIVLLSRGREERLRVPDATLDRVRDWGARVEVHGTGEVIRRYNELAGEGRAVGALIHSTC